MGGWRIGTMVALEEALGDGFARLRALGLDTCQVSCWQPQLLTQAHAGALRAQALAHGVEISSIWAGHSGRTSWTFQEGPATIGLVPLATRPQRLAEYLRAAAFAALVGAPSITTHIGFVPEEPSDERYAPFIACLRILAQGCAGHGVELWLETGQETPVTLLRTISDVAVPGLGINLDPANLILYGKGNPVDALGVFGHLVRGVHAKDGRYPSSGVDLGEETAIGQGQVDFPALAAGLRALGYRGRLIIEREISGAQQAADIAQAITYLRTL